MKVEIKIPFFMAYVLRNLSGKTCRGIAQTLPLCIGGVQFQSSLLSNMGRLLVNFWYFCIIKDNFLKLISEILIIKCLPPRISPLEIISTSPKRGEIYKH